jgi:nucleoside-diphosphate-sugar epimerase
MTGSDIFITGASGVLGRSAVELLAQRGYRIRALASRRIADCLNGPAIEVVEGSLFDLDSLRRAMGACEAILHLATRIPPVNKMGRPESWEENDQIRREGTRNLVSAALTNAIGTFVYPSVCFVYADSADRWIDASTGVLAPVQTLESTLAAEVEIQRFTNAGGRGVALRMGAFYGPQSPQTSQQLKLATSHLAAAFGRPDAYHSSIWIDDAASAVVSALGCPAGVYDVVDDQPLTTKQAILAIARSVGRKKLWRLPKFLLQQVAGKELAEVLGRSQRVSNRRFKAATAWQPDVASLESGWKRITGD